MVFPLKLFTRFFLVFCFQKFVLSGMDFFEFIIFGFHADSWMCSSVIFKTNFEYIFNKFNKFSSHYFSGALRALPSCYFPSWYWWYKCWIFYCLTCLWGVALYLFFLVYFLSLVQIGSILLIKVSKLLILCPVFSILLLSPWTCS